MEALALCSATLLAEIATWTVIFHTDYSIEWVEVCLKVYLVPEIPTIMIQIHLYYCEKST